MRLSVKIMLIICGIFLAMVFLFHNITTRVILGSFERLEEQNIITNIDRVVNTLKQDFTALESTGGDWGAWGETRDFLTDMSRHYIDDNLSITTLENLNLNFILYLDNNGRPLYAFGIKFGEETQEDPVSTELIELIRGHEAFYTHSNAEDAKTGVILLSEGMALMTAWPISNNEMEGPVSGTLVMGRYLGDEDVKSLEKRTQLEVVIERTDNYQAQDDIKAAGAELLKGNEVAINRDLPDKISGYAFLKDIYGKDSLIIKVSTPRSIFNQGLTTTDYFRWVHLIVGLIVFAALLIILQFAVVRPILRLKNHALSVAKSGDLSMRLSFRSRDEIGALAGAFDRMLEQLSEARDRLMEQSYYSGIGEMASGVLHNIRNIMTPMVGQIDKIKERINEAPVDNIEQAVKELNADNLEEERERSLKRYMQLACSRIGGVCSDIANSITIIMEQANHIEDALSQHEKFGNFKKAIAPLSVQKIINGAVDLMPKSLRDAVDIEMDQGLSGLPLVYAESVILTQVVANLLNNATESILRKGTKRGNIWISGTYETEGDVQKVHITIRDNGEGIHRDNLKKIFNRGYSTRVPKSAGLGLHWSANALSAINAEIYSESEGIGLGSSFHIKLPAVRN
ncbi:MAG: HAMP domain-containing protein [Deltaproteobacteria bacterium]|nr:HAMP domain-containing protein [Deltaproteobacteria bacterium]